MDKLQNLHFRKHPRPCGGQVARNLPGGLLIEERATVPETLDPLGCCEGGIYCGEDLEAAFEWQVGGLDATGIQGGYVAVNHADQLELYSDVNRWYIHFPGSGTFYQSNGSGLLTAEFSKVGAFTPNQGTAPASFRLFAFPPLVDIWKDGASETARYVLGASGTATYESASYTLSWNSGSGEWEEILSGFFTGPTTFCNPAGVYEGGGDKLRVVVPGKNFGGLDDVQISEDSTEGDSVVFDSAGNAVTTGSVTGGMNVPIGTTAQRLASEGAIRVNSTLGTTEIYRGAAWRDLEAGTAEVNDLTAAVTWANVPDANVTQSSVTQHEAALTIGFSQITGADADLGTFSLPANTTISTFGASLVDDASAADARTTLGVDAAGTDNSTNVTLAGTLDYLTLSGQEITRNAIDLTTDVTGDLPVADGGTGASTAAAARTNLGTNDASNLTTGTLPPARLGAASIDAITEIATALKTGSVAKLVTGTAGTGGNVPEWDANGDIVDSGLGAAGIQRLQTSTRTATTSVIPTDSTIPQSSEGTLIFTMTHTVASNTALLEIDVVLHLSASGAISVVYALFEPSASANALAASYWTCPGANYGITVPLRYYFYLPTSGSRSFTVRVGTNTASTTAVVNGGFSASQYLGGVETSSMTIREFSKSP